MMTTMLRMRQQAYDNQYPELYDLPDEHEYTGEVWIEQIKFEFVLGNLETVEMHADMFVGLLDTTKMRNKADEIAMDLWLDQIRLGEI